MTDQPSARDVIARFEDKFIPEPNSGCWLWVASFDGAGYGAFKLPDRQVGAHRAAWELFRGPITDGLWVLHKCDVRSCVNPSHLSLGTPNDNVQDCVSKSRQAKGEKHSAKLRSIARCGADHWTARNPLLRKKLGRPGESHWLAKITEETAREIFRRAHAGELYKSLADEFGISKSRISRIVCGKAWLSIHKQGQMLSPSQAAGTTPPSSAKP